MASSSMRKVHQLPQLEVPADLKPVYANMVRIAHMPSEMAFDFALKLPGNQGAKILAQVLMSPLSAKLFHRALTENITKYEAAFGEIKVPGEQSIQDYSQLFRPPKSDSEDEEE